MSELARPTAITGGLFATVDMSRRGRMQARRPSVEVGELLLVKRANGSVWRSAKQVRLWDNYIMLREWPVVKRRTAGV